MNREEKASAISELGEGIGQATNAFVISFKGITVPQVTELRRQVRDTNSTYVVVKNTLALIAVKDSPLTALKDQFSGPTASATASVRLNARAVGPLNCSLSAVSGESFPAISARVFLTTT